MAFTPHTWEEVPRDWGVCQRMVSRHMQFFKETKSATVVRGQEREGGGQTSKSGNER